MMQSYLESYAETERRERRKLPPWLRKLRGEAIQRFERLGFPTTRHEEWRLTSLAPLEREIFAPAGNAGRRRLMDPELTEVLVAGAHGPRAVFVDGRYVPEYSVPGDLPAGSVFLTLREAAVRHTALLEPHFGKYADAERGLVALNTAFFSEGLLLHLPKSAALPLPVQIVYVSTRAEVPSVSHPRNLVVLEEGAEATLVETYFGLERGRSFTNAVTEIVLGENASLDHYKFQKERLESLHTATIHAHQGRASRLTTNSLSLGGGLVRNDIDVTLADEGASCVLNGLYTGSAEQHVDHHTRIDHARPHGSSAEFYKGILDEKARGVFDGMIRVRPGAQKTDARQTNRNLLLSEEALVDSVPRLEINADDVKCSHGATIGALDEDAIFYLRSRGLGRAEARNLLTYAFANEIVERIKPAALKTYLDCYLLTHFSDGHLRARP